MEEWEIVPGYENYEVSNLGSVRGEHNECVKPHFTNGGYTMVKLSKNNKAKRFSIHRLVALAFIPNPEDKPTVDHINRDIYDNRVQNLRWATNSEQAINRDYTIGASGHRCIDKTPYGWTVRIRRDRILVYSKTFKTLPETIAARDAFLGHIGSD